MKSVIVTTLHRGVFFGYINPRQEGNKTLALNKCRNVIKWVGSRGFLGLASHGPEEGSLIGSEAPRVLLHDVTSVSDCTDTAAERFTSWTR